MDCILNHVFSNTIINVTPAIAYPFTALNAEREREVFFLTSCRPNLIIDACEILALIVEKMKRISYEI